jgi:hypothetical protein
MPASRTRKATPRRLAAASPPTAGPLQDQIKDEVSARIRGRLGLGERDALPEAIENLVDAAARDVTENAVEIAVIREVEEAARHLRGSASSGAITSPPDLGILQDAETLAVKRKALQGAGFSREEAMRILVAEISAGAGVKWA